MRLLTSLIAAAMLAAPILSERAAFAEQGCTFQNAIYTERDNGYELQFRKPKPWESIGMVEAVFDLVMPDGRRLWGEIAGNMGTSRSEGRVFFGCSRPGPDGDDLSEEQYDACRQWEGVVYAIVDGAPEMLPFADDAAPKMLLLTDLGRQIRYSDVVSNPGDEPWDVFTYKACAK